MIDLRHIRLVTRSAAQEAVEDRRWLLSQGFDPKDMPKRATWYKADGQALPNCHTDPYHRKLYRERGFTCSDSHPDSSAITDSGGRTEVHDRKVRAGRPGEVRAGGGEGVANTQFLDT